jgi:cob(I)alamin adenosyltransferase
VKQHEESLVLVRTVTKRLFDLAEQLATKEIESDPKGFIIRENINRMTAKKQNL